MTSRPQRQLYKHEQAKHDLVKIYAFLFERNDRAAERFLAECRKPFELLLQMPGVGHPWRPLLRSFPELRVFPVSRRFKKYLIFYQPVSDGVRIVTIMHGTRDLLPLLELLPEGNLEDERE
jgi:toxin ParE1/3/4